VGLRYLMDVHVPRASVGLCVEDLGLLSTVLDEEEMADKIVYLPL